MPKVIDAIFENGVFRPLEKVHVPEHKKLKIIIENEAEAPVKKKSSLAGIIDIAKDCVDTDLSVHHDKFLYSEHS
ncbi:MAG: antitoxin family protein [Nitrospirae bacterium]|nr:antitoxin family protein [Nitrospirota bacterium]